MNIRPRNIPKFQGGNNIWYLGLVDYDPTKYLVTYNTSRLVNGDMSDTILAPWKSNISGYDKGRYLPTTGYGAFGENNAHFNYTKGVEGQNYYEKFGKDLLDSKGNFTPMGEAWAKAVDALLPLGSQATFYDPATQKLRTGWVTLYRDAHGRPAKTFTNLADYVNYVRNDQILGARHNVFLNQGKRYFYIDNLGQKHWVSPEDAFRYNVSKDPSEQGWEGTTYWNDYELTGLKDSSQSSGSLETDPTKKGNGSLEEGLKKDPESFMDKFNASLKTIAPDLLDAIRLGLNLNNNQRVFNTMMKAVRPNLQQSYHTHRQVVGDEATKLAYYRRAALGETKAALPFTSDADRQIAYMNEAKRIGDELRAQGDLADNLEIRRTSDESNQHQWANVQRDTEVANHNVVEINNANATKRNLEAQKYAADTTNWDNYLMGIQNRLEQKRLKLESINDTINTLSMLDALANDPEIKEATLEYEATIKRLYPDGDIDYNDYRVKEAISKFKTALRKAQIRNYRLYFGKSGMKVSYERDDKYLYKTSRDLVEHFRKMSKMADDSRIKSRTKPIKLSEHPKGRGARRYQLGGVAPFTIYRPLPIGGQAMSALTSSSSGSSKKDDKEKDKLDMIKELFKAIQGQGLPVDVGIAYKEISNVINRAKAFGDDLTTDDIASMYLKSMNTISQLKHGKEMYDKALALATLNDSLKEFAVDALGNYVVQDTETGKLSTVSSLSELKEKGLNPITNEQLLDLRAYNPNLAMRTGDYYVMNIVNNGMGINKIGALIKALAGNLGSSETKLDGLTQVESNKVKQGLLILANAPDGWYKHNTVDENLKALVTAALGYIENMLSPAQKATLNVYGGVRLNIMKFLASQSSSTTDISFTPLTGKAATKKDGSGGKGSDITPAIALSMGLGERETFVISDKTLDGLKVYAVNLPLLDAQHHAMAAATLQLVGSGDYAGQLQLNSATMGGVKISPEGINDILISEGRIHAAELPIDMAAYQSTGVIKPNLNFLKNIEKADELVRQAGITNRDNLTAELIKTINSIYSKNNLPIIYTMDGDGKPMLTSEYRRFALMKATAPQTAFEEELNFNDGAIEASDDDRTRFESIMKLITNNDKYSLDNGISIPGIGRITGTDLYKGIIYVPMTESHISALASTGYKASPEEYNEIDALDLQALFIRSSGFKNAGSFTKIN